MLNQVHFSPFLNNFIGDLIAAEISIENADASSLVVVIGIFYETSLYHVRHGKNEHLCVNID